MRRTWNPKRDVRGDIMQVCTAFDPRMAGTVSGDEHVRVVALIIVGSLRASISSPESVSSRIASLGSSMAI